MQFDQVSKYKPYGTWSFSNLLIMNSSCGSSTAIPHTSFCHALRTVPHRTSTMQHLSFYFLPQHLTSPNRGKKTAFPWSPIPHKGFTKSSKWRGCYAPSIPQHEYAVKHAIRQQKLFTFYCTWCGPASGFHKAVSVYHTWLSNNPVVGQTQLYPEDITQEILYWSSLCTSLPSYSFPLPNFALFVFSLFYYLYTTL